MKNEQNTQKPKYEKTIHEEKISCDDISIYPFKSAPNKIVYAGKCKGERKTCCHLKTRLVKTTERKEMITRPPQIVMEIIMDEYHIEEMGYLKIPHKLWKSQGKIFINLEEFIEKIQPFIKKCNEWRKENTKPTSLDEWMGDN